MCSGRQRGLREPIGIVAIGMERSRGIDDRIEPPKRRQIAVAVKAKRVAVQSRRKRLCLRRIAPRDRDRVTVPAQKLGQPPAEYAIAAKDQDLHRSSRL